MASVMSTIEIIMGTVYVVSTIKSVVGSAQYVHSWYKWARKKKLEPTVEPWQWWRKTTIFSSRLHSNRSKDALDGDLPWHVCRRNVPPWSPQRPGDR